MVSGLYGSLQDKNFKKLCPGRNSGRPIFLFFVPALAQICFLGTALSKMYKYGAAPYTYTAVTLLLLYGSAYAVRGGH